MRRLFFLFFVCSIVACNLGAPEPTPQPLPTTNPLPTNPSGSKPSLTVSSPRSGDSFPVNAPIFVNAVATSSEGVTRVQLYANGSPVKTVSSVSPLGDTTLNATLDYTPRAVGTVNLRVLAFRGAISSDPVDLQVNVTNAGTQPTPLPTTGGGGSSGGGNVVIPPDGVCRVLTNTAVNFRSSPTTTQQNVILTLPASTLAPVLARLPDNTWWKIAYNNQFGWVFGQLVTMTGNCFSIPVELGVTPTPTSSPTSTTVPPTNTPSAPSATPVPQRPDLLVTNIFGRTTISLGGGSVTESYSVTITNAGIGPAGQFSAVMSVNNGPTLDLGTVSGLDRGQSVVLQREITFSAAGTYNIRVDVDPANTVPETSDVNNRGDITVTVTN
jgi:hypothetical protein